MRKILIFLWLTAPLAWAGKGKQDAAIQKPSSETGKIEILNVHEERGLLKRKTKESSYEEDSEEPDQTGRYDIRPDQEEKKESAKNAWSHAQNVTKKEIYAEIMEDLPDILNKKIEEKLRTLSNPLKKEEENPGFVKRLTEKIWGKDPSVIADDAIYASKAKVPEEGKKDTEEKKTESRTPSGAKSFIKMVGHEVKIPLTKVILSAGLVALGFFANEFKNEFKNEPFPKNPENEELDNLTHQIKNCTLNATTESEETSWFRQGLVEPLNHATTLFGDSWNMLWGRTEEAQKEISPNVNHFPETEKLTQKGLSSKTEKEL